MQAKYNGLPLFNVCEDDFLYVAECLCLDGNKRLLSKNIRTESLREYYVASRKPEFAVSFNNTVICWYR